MNCAQWEEVVARSVEGDLEAPEAARMAEHLAACSACRRLAAELRQTKAALGELTGEEPDAAIYADLRARVLERIDGRTRWRWAAYPAAAVLLIGLSVVTLLRLEAPDSPRPVQIAVTPPRPVPPEATPRQPRQAPVRKPRPRQPAQPVLLARAEEPLVIKMLTDDPDIVIIWLVDRNGE